MKKKYLLLLILPLLLSACTQNRLETVNNTIENNQMGEASLTNDITKERNTDTKKPEEETIEKTNNIPINADIDLSKKAQTKASPTPLPAMYDVTELEIEDIQIGTGKEAANGNMLTVDYEGWLVDGTMFDSSIKRGRPFQFELGLGRVIKGWDEGMLGMKEGGKRRLNIPTDMAYGDRPPGEVIPPGATLVFEVTLLKVE